ncbi:MAG: hypothetical protein V1681_10110, partial [Candidatus Neomarinimicrobiota bacterium]
KAMMIGGNVGIGHGLGVAAELELPPYGDLEFLKFIPGFGMDLQVGLNDGFFVQNAICVRLKPIELPLYVKAGAGVGLHKNPNTMGIYIPVILGADYFLTEKIAATTSMTFGDGFRLTLGIGFGFGFSKAE